MSGLALPWYQLGTSMAANGGSTQWRNIPDVSLLAEAVTDYYDNGTVGAVDGTSAATPLWAAFVALVNQQASAQGLQTLGFPNPAFYAIGNGANYTSAFHDITAGTNSLGGTDPAYFSAMADYDLATGWGSPNGMAMINALLGTIPMPTSGGATHTASPTVGVTLTDTPSAIPTETGTPSPTLSVSPTATLTDSPTFSVSPTATLTDSPTFSVSPTVTLTGSPTFSVSPTATPMNSPPVSITLTSTLTVSPAPSVSFSASPTASKTAIPTTSATNLETETPMREPTSRFSSSGSFFTAPNPGHNRIFAGFQLDKSATVALDLYSLNGQIVKHWDLGVLSAGEQGTWLDVSGLASGVYLLSLD
ncbi:MAG: T9SS type A sorting domain-containing protein, partial [bacterium]